MWSLAEMEQVLRNLDARLRNVEQILPTLATKADLQEFATKADLQEFATKADLQEFATKADLRELATKVELQGLAMKAELQGLATKAELREGLDQQFVRTRILIESLRDDIRLIAEGHVSLARRVDRLESR